MTSKTKATHEHKCKSCKEVFECDEAHQQPVDETKVYCPSCYDYLWEFDKDALSV